ncbi:centromere protein Q [Chanos chanos]|uniref:Centromere protein Q n=1 Tax=Chanos chanos TaxID=29144 RepID=A0A6J2VT30_CHACN|nr:centromere protein Q [Chanos chanos]
MRPPRGSRRTSIEGPKGRGRGERTRQEKSVQRPGPSNGSVHPQQTKKRSSKSAPVAVQKVRGQEKWKPMSKSSILALDNMLSLSVLSVLSKKMKDKERPQEHLNLLKVGFLARCAQLPVPLRKHDMEKVTRQYQTEIRKTELGKKRLHALEENQASVVSTLEQMEIRIESLEEECRILRNRLEEEEDNAGELLQQKDQTVLCLPALPPHSRSEPSLQAMDSSSQ